MFSVTTSASAINTCFSSRKSIRTVKTSSNYACWFCSSRPVPTWSNFRKTGLLNKASKHVCVCVGGPGMKGTTEKLLDETGSKKSWDLLWVYTVLKVVWKSWGLPLTPLPYPLLQSTTPLPLSWGGWAKSWGLRVPTPETPYFKPWCVHDVAIYKPVWEYSCSLAESVDQAGDSSLWVWVS